MGKSRKKLDLEKLYLPCIAIIIAFFIASCVILVSGFSPVDVLASIFDGAFGSVSSFLNTLSRMTPILMTGLAYAVSSRAGLVNIGIEGQFCAGAFTAVLVGLNMEEIPPFLHCAAAILAGTAVGAVCGAFVALMKVKFHAHEFITSIMFNMIVLYVTSFFVSGPLKEEGDMAQTKLVHDSARLTMLSERAQLSVGIIMAVILALLLYYLAEHTVYGYELKISGLSAQAAKFSGINVTGAVLKAMVLSGAVAGLGGAVYLLGSFGRYVDGFSPGFGYDGIAVSALANGNPLGCILSALLFGGLKAGSVKLNIMTRIPVEFVDLIQAIIIILISAPLLTRSFTSVFKRKKGAE